jgi:dTDP-4-amino-4,6-dideoxygalactose transaminase
MAGVVGTFVPTYQGLAPTHLVRRPYASEAPFPFNASRRIAYYRARNAIYHLFRTLRTTRRSLTVLAPDYYSGNEILAMQAAGVTIQYCPVGADMQWDPAEVERLCRAHSPDILYVIHYAGWPQPIAQLAEICRTREVLLVEDCALSLLSETDEGRPLGSFGQWSVFCLYKTLPLPNGALLVQNEFPIESLERLHLRPAGAASVAARVAELFVQRIRGRFNGVGAALQTIKRAMGMAAGALDVHRANVGDIGFNLDEVDLAMSPVSTRLLQRLDYSEIRRRRAANYRQLLQELDSQVRPMFPTLPDRVCPLFFPVIVPNKAEAANALRRRGVEALEFWNDPVGDGSEMSPHARFFRAHVLELPIHQDLSARHVSHVARQVNLTLGAGRNVRRAA